MKSKASRHSRAAFTRALPAAFLAMCLGLAPGAPAAQQGEDQPLLAKQQTENLQIQCRQQGLRLECTYQQFPEQPGAPEEILPHAWFGARELSIKEHLAYPRHGELTSILFLVDTSDPRRAAVVQRNAAQIRAMLADAAPHQRFGLAAFDKDMRVLAAPGGTAEETIQATHELRAIGTNTELYRCALKALRLLSTQPAARRALFVFSDGLAEDTAYFAEDVVRMARGTDTAIYGVGFALTVDNRPGLQSLRRLSEDTGGLFVEAARDLGLPHGFLQEPFAGLESGGSFQVDATGLFPKGTASGEASLRLHFTVGEEPLPDEFQVPLRTPQLVRTPQPVVSPAAPETRQPPSPTIQLTPPPAALLPSQAWWWTGIALSGAALLLLAILLLMLRQHRRRMAEAASQPSPGAPVRIYGYLLPHEGNPGEQKNTPIPIDCIPFRIGRIQTNDLVLDDPSVSRQHAEIDYADGHLLARDLESLNGLLVNGERVKDSRLADNDQLDVGEFTLHLKVENPQGQDSEATLFIKTSMHGE